MKTCSLFIGREVVEDSQKRKQRNITATIAVNTSHDTFCIINLGERRVVDDEMVAIKRLVLVAVELCEKLGLDIINTKLLDDEALNVLQLERKED